MAGLKVSEFDPASALNGSELIGIVQGAENRRTTITDVVNLASAGTGFAPLLLVPETVAGTTYTIQDTDKYVAKRFTNAALVTITVPLNATVAVPVGSRIRLIVLGAAGITIAKGDPSITLVTVAGAVDGEQNEILELHKTGTDEWSLLGNFV